MAQASTSARSHTRGARAAAAVFAVGLLAAASLAAADFGCSPAPLQACRDTTRPHESRLLLRSGPRADKHTLVWKWYRGEATPVEAFGSPTTTDSYAFCIYDAGQNVVFQSVVPPGGSCNANSCWNPVGNRGFRYRNGKATADGLTKFRLFSGTEGRAKIIVKGRGENLPPADLPLALPVLVQLQASNGECWEASYNLDGVAQNDSARFGGRSAQ
jgi:hypothetical protein